MKKKRIVPLLKLIETTKGNSPMMRLTKENSYANNLNFYCFTHEI